MEAALIFPLLIISMAIIINLAIHFYEEVCEQTEKYRIEREAYMVEERYQGKEASFIRTLDSTIEVVK